MGQKQPLNTAKILTSERLLSGYTGHSPLSVTGCFRPGADLNTRSHWPLRRSWDFSAQLPHA